MKELWTTNPFHLVNGPFAEMGYSSSEPNIVPAHLLLAIRTPLAAPPRAASASPLRATRRPPTHHPLASGAASAVSLQHTARHLVAPCKPSANAPVHHHPLVPCTASAISPQTIHHRAAHHPLAPCATSVGSLHAICPPAHRDARRLSTNHPSTHGAGSAAPPHVIRWLPADNPQARAALPVPPAQHPPTRTDTLNPRKNTLCTIVNCPLQIKPVFYFLFTSTAPPAHRIRVKSSLLRLGRFCLALPFTHLGKDIT